MVLVESVSRLLTSALFDIWGLTSAGFYETYLFPWHGAGWRLFEMKQRDEQFDRSMCERLSKSFRDRCPAPYERNKTIDDCVLC